MNAPGVEPVIELARDVPGPLDQQSERDTAAKQPVNPRDVCSQVAADQDRASAFGQRGAQALVAANVESAQDGFVGLAVERVVAREEPRRVGRQRWPGRLDRPVRIERRAGPLERRAHPHRALRPHHHRQPTQKAQDRVAARRSQPA